MQLSDEGWIALKAGAIGSSLLHHDLSESDGEPEMVARAERLADYLFDLCAQARPDIDADDDLEQSFYDRATTRWHAIVDGGSVQVCRDCGKTFPYEPDRDRCEACSPGPVDVRGGAFVHA